MSGFINWLGFIFDTGANIKTQKVLLTFSENLMTTTEKFLDINRSTLTDGIKTVEDKIRPYVKDTRPPTPTMSSTLNNIVNDVMGWVFDNPIMGLYMKYNVVQWFMEAGKEYYSASIKVPSLDAVNEIITEIIPHLVGEELNNVLRLIEDLQAKMKDISLDLSKVPSDIFALIQDAFWTFWDAVKFIVVTSYDVLAALLRQMFEFWKGVWKIPMFTPLYEDFTGQEFSLLNAGTYFVAGVLNLYFIAKEGKTPFGALGDPNGLFSMLKDENLDLRTFFSRDAASAKIKEVVSTSDHTLGVKTAISKTTPPAERSEMLAAVPAATSATAETSSDLKSVSSTTFTYLYLLYLLIANFSSPIITPTKSA